MLWRFYLAVLTGVYIYCAHHILSDLVFLLLFFVCNTYFMNISYN